jgi:hypothetical protein
VRSGDDGPLLFTNLHKCRHHLGLVNISRAKISSPYPAKDRHLPRRIVVRALNFYERSGLAGLVDSARSGWPRRIDHENVVPVTWTPATEHWKISPHSARRARPRRNRAAAMIVY